MPKPLVILPDPPPPPAGVGLIAGGGRLPIIVAQGLARVGHPVHGLGLAGQYEPELPALCTSFREVGLLRIGTWSRALGKRDVHHAIMVGYVDKAKLMHERFRLFRHIPDTRTVIAWYKHLKHDRRSHALLAAIADELDRGGVQLLDSTMPIQEELSSAGLMTRRSPTADQQADIDFVWPIFSQMLALDIGQAIAVRDRDVVAVEAVEGTDRMIERVGQLCRASGWTLCKGARCGPDRRSDVPTVGTVTIEKIHKAGGRCLALAAGDVIMIDKEQMLARADALGIAVVGVPVGTA